MTAKTMFRTASAATVLLVTATFGLSAQESNGTNGGANCDRAARGVLERPLPAPGTDGWNHFMELTSCGSRGATVIAGVIQSPMVRAEMDPARLDALAGMLDGWFSPALVSAYESVAATPQASPGMRLRSMWLLSGLLVPNTEVAGPLQGYTAVSCGAYERVTALRGAPSGLPAQAYDDARLAFARAASDPSAPDAVRNTARCWSDVVSGHANAGGTFNASASSDRDDDRDSRVEATPTVINQTVINTGPPPITVIEPIEVRYECDGRFMVLNQSPALMSLRYEVVGAGWGGVMQVGGRSSHVFVAARVGPLRFFVGSREVAYVRYTRRSCYGWRNDYTVVVASRMYYPPPIYRNSRPVVVVRPRGGPVVIGGRDRDRDDRRDNGRDNGRDDRRDNDRDRGRVTPGDPRGGNNGSPQRGRTAEPRGGRPPEIQTSTAAPSISAPRGPNHIQRAAQTAPSVLKRSEGDDRGKGGDHKDEPRSASRRP